ncbi:MAG: hypothetical protein RBQ99_09850, partial [Trichlorobacter sp.]|nr:hypothetical protein [Trichlorobacter sp.]
GSACTGTCTTPDKGSGFHRFTYGGSGGCSGNNWRGRSAAGSGENNPCEQQPSRQASSSSPCTGADVRTNTRWQRRRRKQRTWQQRQNRYTKAQIAASKAVFFGEPPFSLAKETQSHARQK